MLESHECATQEQFVWQSILSELPRREDCDDFIHKSIEIYVLNSAAYCRVGNMPQKLGGSWLQFFLLVLPLSFLLIRLDQNRWLLGGV